MLSTVLVLAQSASTPPKMPPVQFPVALWWLVGGCFALMFVCLVLMLAGWYFKQRWILTVVEFLLPAHLDRAMDDRPRRRRQRR